MENNKEFDTLQIKKNAPQEVVYHYKRPQQAKDIETDKPTGLKKFFKNKSLLFIVCDIILIILIFIFVRSPLFETREKNYTTVMNINEYYFTLSGYRIKDKVFARLYIEKVKESEYSKQENVQVEFSIADNSVQLDEHLPSLESEGVKVQATLLCPDNHQELIATITLGEKREHLSIVPIER